MRRTSTQREAVAAAMAWHNEAISPTEAVTLRVFRLVAARNAAAIRDMLETNKKAYGAL